jgi:hypothetical protein
LYDRIVVFGIFAADMAKHLILLFLFIASTACAQGRYRPGEVVPEPYLKVFGSERFFRVAPIDAELRALMERCSVKSEKGVDWDGLRYLQVLHRDADGNAIVGEMVCNAAVANDLMEIFTALFESGYPIEKMRLIDHYGGDDEASMRDNNTSCFNQRAITAGGRPSKHSYGLAVDINPKYNPYYKLKSSGKVVVKPETGADYLDREGDFPYKIRKGDLCYKLFKQHGFHWGGDWASGKDYQHFEK